MKFQFAFLLLAGSLLNECVGSQICKPHDGFCFGGDCDKEQLCENGRCIPDGSCSCHPCYIGDTCGKYEDSEHFPYFLKNEETIYIEPRQTGLIYQAVAIDEDSFKVCLPESTLPCPCGIINYEIVDLEGNNDDLFTVEENTGNVYLKEHAKLKDGDSFLVEISASNYNENPAFENNILSIDVLKLNVRVRESNPIEDFRTDGDPKVKTREAYETMLSESDNENYLLNNEDEISVNRVKRDAYSTDPTKANFTLSIGNEPITEPVKPGMSIDFELKIILPEITNPTDLTVELFVMDTISGVTTMALCNVHVTDIGGNGGQIKRAGGSALQISDVRKEHHLNNDLNFLYDRAVLSFGSLINDDVIGGTDYGASTIMINFTVIIILNDNYLNSTAIVTAGAAYDSENFVWVGQAAYTYSKTAGPFPSAISLTGPSIIKQGSAGQFNLDGFIVEPFSDATLDIWTPDEKHDKFSVTSLMIVSKGENHACIVDQEIIEYSTSVSGKSHHKATMKFKTLVKNIDYGNLAGEASDPGNLIVFSFTVQLIDAKEGDVISIGVALNMGSNTLWIGSGNVTVEAPGPTLPGTTPPPTYRFRALGNSTGVRTLAIGETATYEVKAQLAAQESYTHISCTATAVSPNKICGVGYGKSGKYAASFPSLLDSEIITYDDTADTATWTLDVLYAKVEGSVDTEEEFVTFEITVVFNDFTSNPTVDCGGVSNDMIAQEGGTPGIEEVSGTAVVLGDDTDWFVGSQAGMLATLTFPSRGVAYSSLLLETAADFFQTNYGSEVCAFDIIHIGRAVMCLAKNASNLEEMLVYKKGLTTSIMDDSVELYLGEICGSVVENPAPDDNNFVVRVIYKIPLQPGAIGSTFNLSIGAMLDDTLIWTGWSDYNFRTDISSFPLTPDKVPLISVLPPELSQQEMFKPFLIQVNLKTYPGTVSAYRVKATSTNPDVIAICRIIILDVGFNYACLDKAPYGKHLDPAQTIKITHDTTDWGKEALLDLGVIRNLGRGDRYEGLIADQDSIVIGIICNGISAGAGDITIHYEDDSSTPFTDVDVSRTITDHTTTTSTSVTLGIVGFDGTDEFYDDVMKQLNVTITAPPTYDRLAYLHIINSKPDDATVCFAQVALAEINVPCVTPSAVLSEKLVGSGGEDIIKLDFKAICHLQINDNLTGDNQINVRVGVMPKKGVNSVTINVEFYEGDPGTVATSEQIEITHQVGVYDPGNYSLNGIEVYAVDNETVTEVEPGNRMWQGIYIQIPPSLTLPIELGVMTSSANGHAYATIHGFRWGEKQGKNIACIEELDMYEYQLLQNASVDGIDMYHESQTDTFTAYLKYLTNTGISYLQMVPKPGDDLAMIEVDLLIADHDEPPPDDLITISFSVKIGRVIVVMDKNLTLVRPAVQNVMVLNTDFFFTDPTFDPLVAVKPGEKISLTGRMQHVLNESHIEAYGAIIRMYTPNFIKFVNASSGLELIDGATADSFNINITSATSTSPTIVFDIGYLFFTDIVEFNITLSVDPYNEMPKGLGMMEATAIMRLVCSESSKDNPAKYCGNATFVNYLVDGSECYDDLQVSTFQSCQFLASSAIDESVGPEKAATAAGWMPAVRDSQTWGHHIAVDFLKKVRITRITFSVVSDKREVKEYKLQTSGDGLIFFDACPHMNLTSGDLPDPCKVEARYARIVIITLNDNDENTAVGVSFQWFGCPLESAVGTCTFPEKGTPLTTNATTWRHSSYDDAHSIVYFCDPNPKKKRMVCYSSPDGTTWNVLPGYIGSLAGYDSNTQKMYAYDTKRTAMVGSSDGIQWGLVDSTFQGSLNMDDLSSTVKVIPGEEKGFAAITIGSWTADFVGMKLGGDYKVKWGKCCD